MTQESEIGMTPQQLSLPLVGVNDLLTLIRISAQTGEWKETLCAYGAFREIEEDFVVEEYLWANNPPTTSLIPPETLEQWTQLLPREEVLFSCVVAVQWVRGTTVYHEAALLTALEALRNGASSTRASLATSAVLADLRIPKSWLRKWGASDLLSGIWQYNEDWIKPPGLGWVDTEDVDDFMYGSMDRRHPLFVFMERWHCHCSKNLIHPRR